MHDLHRKLLAVKDGLSRKSFLHVHPTIMSGDLIVLHDGTQRARVQCAKALEMIPAAPDAETLWLSLEELRATWPRCRGGRPQTPQRG